VLGIKKFFKGLGLVPKTSSEADAKGELEVLDGDGKLRYHNGTSVSPIVTEAHSATLTNKTIDADQNTITNIKNADIKAAAGIVESKLSLDYSTSSLNSAIQNHINDTTDAHDASAISYDNTSSNLTATDVQAAIDEVESRLDTAETNITTNASNLTNHLNDTTDAHDASAISNVPAGTISSTDVQAAINELDGDIQGHINDTSDAHDASAISNVPAGTISATDVQAAINELDGDIQGHVTATQNVHGIGAGNSVVGTGTTQTLTNKTLQGANIQTPVRSDVKQDTKANLQTYAASATNGQLVFATDTKEMFQIVDNNLVSVGSGGEGDVDTLLVQNFDTAALSDFTQTGLILTQTGTIRGAVSAKLVHQSGVDQSFKQTIPVDLKFRGRPMTVSLAAKSTAASGNLIIQFRDETNNIDLQESQQIIATSDVETFQFGVKIPDNCSSFSYKITALPQSGNPESIIDDIVIRNYWIGTANLGQTEYQFEVPVVTEWVDAGPIQIGATGTPPTKGTTSEDSVRWRQVGEDYEVEYKFRQTSAGANGSGDYLVSLPSGVEFDSTIPSFTGTFVATQTIKDMSIISIEGQFTNQTSSVNGLGYAIKWSDNSFRYITNSLPWSSTGAQLGLADVSVNFKLKFKGKNLKATELKKVVSTDLVPAKALTGNSSFEVPVVTEWVDAGPITITATTTNPTKGTTTVDRVLWRRSGDSAEIRMEYVQTGAGTAGSGDYLFAIPSSIGQIDLTKTSTYTANINSNTQRPTAVVGSFQAGGTAMLDGVATVYSSNQIRLIGGVHAFSAGNTITNSIGSSSTNISLNNSPVSYGITFTVPIQGWEATKTETIGLAQSALIKESDSYLRITDFTPALGTTNTRIFTLISGTVRDNIGTDIQYLDDAALGARFIIQSDGIYTFNFSQDLGTSAAGVGFSVNSTQLSTNFSSINGVNKLTSGYDTGTNNIANVSATAFLKEGDVVRLHSESTVGNVGAGFAALTITKQGSLKQININPNQKITIPTSELRMEGASTRGTTATAIVRFDNIAKLRGDAFEVLSDAALGTRIIMKKKGRLSISSTVILSSAGFSLAITKNQTLLTAFPSSASEILGFSTAATNYGVNVSEVTDVNIGDVLRVCSPVTIASDARNSLNLSFQEQDISVSVTNTLPQFSESDSSVRVDTANGYGSSATRIRRFSNVRDNIGNDIEYVSSSVNGDSFVVKSAGVYSISYSEQVPPNVNMGITKNATGTELSTNIITLAGSPTTTSLVLDSAGNASAGTLSCSWQGVLQAGDIIRAHTDGFVSVDNDNCRFTITKVGKPNVTGVDVTPFVNIPQPEVETYVASLNASIQPSIVRRATNSKLFRVSTPTAGRIRFTALKNININASGSISFIGSAPGASAVWYLNGNVPVKSNSNYASASLITIGTESSIEISLVTGEFIEFLGGVYVGGTFSHADVSVLATALSDQILTAPETFSTDTARLVYAPSSQYTLTTLADAPVGTFITFTYAANSNTRTQTTTAPTQSTSDMNVNGIQIFARAYNAASTAAQPAAIAIQIGKGLKGKTLDLYKNTGKSISGSLDFYTISTFNTGMHIKDYNEATGILILDSGFSANASVTTSNFVFSDTTTQTNGYIVINASKNPALTGLNLVQPRIAYVQRFVPPATSGGTSVAGAWNTVPLSQLNDPTGIGISVSSNQITIPAGSYDITGFSSLRTSDNQLRLRNITDGTTTLLGFNVYGGNISDGALMPASCSGIVTISSTKVFELQYRVAVGDTFGLGGASTNFGEDILTASVKIQKLK
jgi:hypothetical protein